MVSDAPKWIHVLTTASLDCNNKNQLHKCQVSFKRLYAPLVLVLCGGTAATGNGSASFSHALDVVM